MVEIEFEYFQNNIIIKANIDDYFSTVFYNFYKKAELEPNSVIFLLGSKRISESQKVLDIINEEEKLKDKIIITVFPLNIDYNHPMFEQSKEIICPKCLKQCRIKIIDYSIKLYDCKNKHSTIMRLDEFYQSQKIDFKSIKCDVCKIKNLGNSNPNQLLYCQNCKINICSLCKKNHDDSHSIINYEQKNYICSTHHESFIKYCHDCGMNICIKCSLSHSEHNLESFEDIIIEPDNKKIELEKIKDEINILSNNIQKIIYGLNQLVKSLETYYKTFNNIFNNYDTKKKNYYVLDTIKQININNIIAKEISEINHCKDNKEKVNKIINFYYKMKRTNNIDPFCFSKDNSNVNIKYDESKLIQFSDISTYIKKDSKITEDSIYRCKYCPYIPLLKIMYKGYQVFMEYRCQNGHYSYEKLYDFYQRNKINSINAVKCSEGDEINDGKQNFYYCNECQKYFCEKDKKIHETTEFHSLINLKYIYNMCTDHFYITNDYCLDCHTNICCKCKDHFEHKKISISKIIIDDEKMKEYRDKLYKLKENYNNFYDECDKTIKEVLDYIKDFNKNLINFKKVNDYSFNICEDLLNSYQYLKDKNYLNYEIIENINSILNFNEIKFNMDKNFNCMARFIYINSIIKLEYNTLFKLNQNFINFDYKITEDEENLIKEKNTNIGDLEYRKVYDKNFENTYYGYFRYDPDGNETRYEINGFGIKINKYYRYIGEFKNGKCHGYGAYYFESGAYKFAKNNLDTTEAFKLYALSGQKEFCLYTKIVGGYQKYGVYYIEMPNGTKKINVVKNNNFDDYGLMYNINGEFYEGYYLSNVRHGYGILNSQAEYKVKTGLFYKGELKLGSLRHKDWISEGEFNIGLKDGYIIEYDRLRRKQFEGVYKDGKRDGFGINYYDNGNISYKGYFKNNLEDTFGFMYNSSGKVFYAGGIDKGQKRGFGIYYAYDQKGDKLYQYSGNWFDDDKCDGYLLKKYPDGDYFFGKTKMFVYQDFMNYKLGNKTYIGETKISSTKREGYGETNYSDGIEEKGIYINDHLVLNTTHNI